MSGDSVRQTAAEMRSQHGVLAKREAARYMLQASKDGRGDAEIFWRAVLKQLIVDEQNDPKIYDTWLDRDISSASSLLAHLRFAAAGASLPSSEDWEIFRSAAGKVASYVEVLETTLAQLLREESGARLAAIKLLVEGPSQD